MNLSISVMKLRFMWFFLNLTGISTYTIDPQIDFK